MNRAVFLDRDGTLIEDKDYLHRPEDVVIFPGVGPALNRQDKLFAHLSIGYLNNMLIAGGRYACGNPNSAMPVWSNEGNPPGPFNYVQVEDIIEFIRAPNTETYTIRDPEQVSRSLRTHVFGTLPQVRAWRSAGASSRCPARQRRCSARNRRPRT